MCLWEGVRATWLKTERHGSAMCSSSKDVKSLVHKPYSISVTGIYTHCEDGNMKYFISWCHWAFEFTINSPCRSSMFTNIHRTTPSFPLSFDHKKKSAWSCINDNAHQEQNSLNWKPNNCLSCFMCIWLRGGFILIVLTNEHSELAKLKTRSCEKVTKENVSWWTLLESI